MLQYKLQSLVIQKLPKAMDSLAFSTMFAGMSRFTTIIITAVPWLLVGSHYAFGGEIYDHYMRQAREELGGDRKYKSYEEASSTNHAITEIGIERTFCFGSCPVYSFVVKSNGTFRYIGFKYVEREGEFSGTFPLRHFDQLAQFVRDSGYMELENSYATLVTDSPTTFTTVVMNGKRKTIRNYADGGPTVLWAVEQLTDDLMDKARWGRPQKMPKKKE